MIDTIRTWLANFFEPRARCEARQQRLAEYFAALRTVAELRAELSALQASAALEKPDPPRLAALERIITSMRSVARINADDLDEVQGRLLAILCRVDAASGVERENATLHAHLNTMMLSKLPHYRIVMGERLIIDAGETKHNPYSPKAN